MANKIKTHSGAKKRFKMTKNGKVKKACAFKSHILTKKETKRDSSSASGQPMPIRPTLRLSKS